DDGVERAVVHHHDLHPVGRIVGREQRFEAVDRHLPAVVVDDDDAHERGDRFHQGPDRTGQGGPTTVRPDDAATPSRSHHCNAFATSSYDHDAALLAAPAASRRHSSSSSSGATAALICSAVLSGARTANPRPPGPADDMVVTTGIPLDWKSAITA